MNKYLIRFNKTRGQPGRGSLDHVWRVFENDQEYQKDILKKIEDKSIQLQICSPPYFNLRSYLKEDSELDPEWTEGSLYLAIDSSDGQRADDTAKYVIPSLAAKELTNPGEKYGHYPKRYCCSSP